MTISDTVIHVFGSEENKGAIIGIGFGKFRNTFNVRWSNGQTFHHKGKYLKESA